MNYSDKLRDPRWQKKRLLIMERDNWACTCCGDTENTLNVHHTKYHGANPWDTPDEFLKTLCEKCHGIYERIKDCEIHYAAKLVSLIPTYFRDSDDKIHVRMWKAIFADGGVTIFFNSPTASLEMPFNKSSFNQFLNFINDGTPE